MLISFFSFLVIFVYVILISDVHAHPGGLDSNGGHTCRSNCEKYGLETGQYHYHISTPDPTPSPSPTIVIEPEPTPTSSIEPPSSSSSKGLVILSEFMPNPQEGNEWVELFNPSQTSVDISSYKIDDIEGGSSPFTIPDSTIINPQQYLYFSFSSKLNNSGDSLRLIGSNGQLVEEYSYQNSKKGVSFAKDAAGTWQKTITPTPGQTNIITTPPSSGKSQKSTKTSPKIKSKSTTTNRPLSSKNKKTIKQKAGFTRPKILSEATNKANINLTATNASYTAESLSAIDVDKNQKQILPFIFLIGGGGVLIGSAAYRYFKKRQG